MTNTSATGGYLAPTTILEGEALENFFHDVIVGITGVGTNLVRPSWQPEPPSTPKRDDVWIAFHFQDESSDDQPALVELIGEDGNAYQQLQENEELSVVVSVYGTGASSGARAAAKRLRDGLRIAQNREAITAVGMGIVSVSNPIPAPVLVKTIWQYRVDLIIRVRRMIVRDYQVAELSGADNTIHAQTSSCEVVRTIAVEETTS